MQAEGWEAACHSYALEVLGYARNRAPMLRLAAKYPLAAMRVDGMNGDDLFAEEAAQWKLNGLRPANHPRRRLAQYLADRATATALARAFGGLFKDLLLGRGVRPRQIFAKSVSLPKRRAVLSELLFN